MRFLLRRITPPITPPVPNSSHSLDPYFLWKFFTWKKKALGADRDRVPRAVGGGHHATIRVRAALGLALGLALFVALATIALLRGPPPSRCSVPGGL